MLVQVLLTINILFLFSPSVDMVTGRPCVDFLDDFSQWKESYSIADILSAIQVNNL